MKCQRCSRPATYHITDVEGRKFQEFHLCDDCASKHLAPTPEPDDPFPISKLAKELAMSNQQRPDAEARRQPACPMCGITFAEFRGSGRLGCSHDYEAFRDELMPLLENIHESVSHEGKAPRRAPRATQQLLQLVQLRNELKKAVSAEDYERAAKLRDQIKTMEQTTGRRGS